MNEQEAIMIIQAIPEKIWNQMDKSEEEAIAMAIKSLEKQIPKKILRKWDYTRGDHSFYRWTCSKCERDIKNISAEYDYCPYCGQKLDWSEEE